MLNKSSHSFQQTLFTQRDKYFYTISSSFFSPKEIRRKVFTNYNIRCLLQTKNKTKKYDTTNCFLCYLVYMQKRENFKKRNNFKEKMIKPQNKI